MVRKLSLVLLVIVVAASFNLIESKPVNSLSEPPDVMCRLPEVRGHCRALIMRWRYDPATGKCYEFGFGGCDGNSNNFPSKKACIDMCSEIR